MGVALDNGLVLVELVPCLLVELIEGVRITLGRTGLRAGDLVAGVTLLSGEAGGCLAFPVCVDGRERSALALELLLAFSVFSLRSSSCLWFEVSCCFFLDLGGAISELTVASSDSESSFFFLPGVQPSSSDSSSLDSLPLLRSASTLPSSSLSSMESLRVGVA